MVIKKKYKILVYTSNENDRDRDGVVLESKNNTFYRINFECYDDSFYGDGRSSSFHFPLVINIFPHHFFYFPHALVCLIYFPRAFLV